MTYIYDVHRAGDVFKVVRKDDYTDDAYEAENALEIGTYKNPACARMLAGILYTAQREGNI